MSEIEAVADVNTPRTSVGLERVTGAVALFGGALCLATACLVTLSVLGRWLFSAPVEGDFDYVKMGTAISVFAYLPYTKARRGNIMVDTFTSRLPNRMLNRIDAFWDLGTAAIMSVFAAGLAMGAHEAYLTREATMQAQIPLWPAIGLCAVLCAMLCVTALVTAAIKFGGKIKSGDRA